LGIEKAQSKELHKAKNAIVSNIPVNKSNYCYIKKYTFSIILINEKLISHKHILITIYSPKARLLFLDLYYKITKSIVKLTKLVTTKIIEIQLI
jgi:hypothetical protein